MNIPLDKNTRTIKIPALVLAPLLFFAVLNFPLFQNHEAQKALALLLLVAVLWMTEAIPLALTYSFGSLLGKQYCCNGNDDSLGFGITGLVANKSHHG
jgi:hypothetical protein